MDEMVLFMCQTVKFVNLSVVFAMIQSLGAEALGKVRGAMNAANSVSVGLSRCATLAIVLDRQLAS
ncbi:hypothetical protein E8K88_17800 [Lampropedia aestuarii]|uniref:Uncharacterized protein n=1 Tax=Lampropedia aestuarii TaxID=2562762 RepID=A0A4S5BIA1_9BURK|nr:hypothetical protein [Lampropedia aestuarii]THJ30301.1 hypothetical protein E8K88_17800 [Lampropedia aestuarii]